MRRGVAQGHEAQWRALGVLALAVVALGCCCPALPPPALAWQLEALAPRALRTAQGLPPQAR